ncbi:MAG: 30S ribosomal protein S2 [Candidatus Bipolaricaulota bacterium]|nr:30S ribosomal protein S2 [Candidatus Bipolaricaulota bacterium]
MELLTMKELLETGVHFGHRTQRWNPKMEKYIFMERKGIHIIDLESTQALFEETYDFVRDQVRHGAEILFVGTKRQVQNIIEKQGKRCGAHYVNHRWLGGTLTNFDTIRDSVDRMIKLERMSQDGTFEQLPNKEVVKLRRELKKKKRNYDGIRDMEEPPDMVYVIDPEAEQIAVHEARILDIPVIGITDTNCDPDLIDYPIPGNDDAIKATRLLTSRLADAVIEGREGADQSLEEEEVEAETEEPAAEETEEVEEETEPAAEEAEEETEEETTEEETAEEEVEEEAEVEGASA